MAGRPSKRNQMLMTARDLFITRGFANTSVADIAKKAGVSKAAFVYHFDSKDALLLELAEPLLDALDEVLADHPKPARNAQIGLLLSDYLGALLDNAAVSEWVDGDKSVLHHPVLGARLTQNNQTMREILAGGRPLGPRGHAQASAIVGMLWRPVRNLDGDDVAQHSDAIIELATAAVAQLRRSLKPS